MKKLTLLLILALVGVWLLPAAQPALAEQVGLPNPVHEVSTRQEAEEAGGEFFFLPPLPEGAQDIAYSWIDGTPVIVQASFLWENNRFLVRGAATDSLEDITGMYYDWTFDHPLRIGVFPGRVQFNEDGQGVILWYDVLQNSTYSASMSEGATLQTLMSLGNAMAEWQQEEAPEIAGDETDSQLLAGLGWAEKSDREAVAKALGFELDASGGAGNVRYYLYPLNGADYRAAVRFELDGVEGCLWAGRSDGLTDVSDIAVPVPMWEASDLGPSEAILAYNPGGEGRIIWFNGETGISYTMALVKGASPEKLVEVAGKIL